jgi:hypothetical protein
MIGVDEGSDDLAQSEAKRHQTSRKLAALPGVRTYQSPWRNKLKGISPPWPITPSTWTSASCSKPQERSRSALVRIWPRAVIPIGRPPCVAITHAVPGFRRWIAWHGARAADRNVRHRQPVHNDPRSGSI